MLDVSNDFLTAIKDESKEKVVLMIVNTYTLWFTKEDFSQEGITVDEYFCTSNDLTYGNTSSARCSFTIFADGIADGVNAFLVSQTMTPLAPLFGVEVDREDFSFDEGVLSHIEFAPNEENPQNTVVLEGRTDGLYFNNTKVDNGVYKTLLFEGNAYVVCLGDSDALYLVCSDTAVEESGTFDAEDFMTHKFVTYGKASWAIQYDFSRGYDASRYWITWEEGAKVTYEMIPAGFFYPQSTNISKAYIGNAITFTDMPDAMYMWDQYQLAPESAFVEYLNTPQTTDFPYVQYPMSMNDMYDILVYFMYPGFDRSLDPSTQTWFDNISFSANPLNSYGFNYRQLCGWMAEASRSNIWCDRRNWTGMSARWLNSDPDQVETLTTSDIGIDGFNIAWYKTQPINRVVLEHSGGGYDEFIIDPDDDSTETYVISNPLIQSMTQEEAEAFAEGIPTYYPITFTVINANPAVEVGDMIEITGTEIGEEESFTIPLMHRRITFNGVGFTAEYEATGGYKRESYEGDDLQTNITKNAQDIDDIKSAGYLTASTGVTSVNGSHGDVTVSDTKVTQTYGNYSSYSNWRPLVIGNSNGSSESFTPSTVTNTTYTFSNLKVQPSTGTLKATTFKGNLTGTASGNVASCSGSANASGSVTFNLSNGFRGVLVVQGATSGTNGIYMVWVSSSGSVTSYDVRAASSVTFATGTGTMTLTAPSSTGIQVIWYITNGTATVA